MKYIIDMAIRKSRKSAISANPSTLTAAVQTKSVSAAARKIASLVEEHMTEKGWSEEEKDERVASFSRGVDAIRARASRSR